MGWVGVGGTRWSTRCGGLPEAEMGVGVVVRRGPREVSRRVPLSRLHDSPCWAYSSVASSRRATFSAPACLARVAAPSGSCMPPYLVLQK